MTSPDLAPTPGESTAAPDGEDTSEASETSYTTDRASAAPEADPALAAWAADHVYAVRHGIFLLESGKKSDPDSGFFGAVCDAVRADSRVHDLQRPAFEPDWSHTYRFVPPMSESSPIGLLSNDDDFGVARFGKPIVFRVIAPRADQSPFRGNAEIPTDTYYVAWDGLLLTVLWEQRATATQVSQAGGRIVYDLLSAAVERAGARTRVQACSPGCTNMFTHTDAMLIGNANSAVVNWRRLVVFRVSSHRPPLEEVELWHGRLAQSAMFFAQMKSVGRRVRDLESLARSGLAFALTQRQKREERRSDAWRSRLQHSWHHRGWRRSMAEALSDVWLSVARLEEYQREWEDRRRKFLEEAKRADVRRLFKVDRADDELAIGSIDLTLIREALEHSGNRLDANMLSLVTGMAAGGGIFGGVVGALVARAVGS